MSKKDMSLFQISHLYSIKREKIVFPFYISVVLLLDHVICLLEPGLRAPNTCVFPVWVSCDLLLTLFKADQEAKLTKLIGYCQFVWQVHIHVLVKVVPMVQLVTFLTHNSMVRFLLIV